MMRKFCEDRKIKQKTIESYKNAIKDYENFNNEKIETLIWEALDEQSHNKPEVEKQLFNRLEDYREYLSNDNSIAPSTKKQRLRLVRTFYRHFRVNVPDLYVQQTPDEYETNYYDIPNKKHIRKALTICDGAMRSVILFMCSSGTAKEETLNLKVSDFIKATVDYHDNDGGLHNILNQLKKRNDIIPLFYVKRVKTGNYYHTCCSPEASNAIIDELLSRKELDYDNRLFDFTHRRLIHNFQKINDKMGWGYVKRYRFFRSHSLRKFHGSNIGLNENDINALQGRSNKEMAKIYMKKNPQELRDKYKSVLDNVTIDNKPLSIENAEFHIHINVMLMGSDYGIQI